MNNNNDHVLMGTRPFPEPNPNNPDNDDQFDSGKMEHFMVRNGGNDLNADELRKKHAESMTRRANAICCKSYNQPLVLLNHFIYKLNN